MNTWIIPHSTKQLQNLCWKTLINVGVWGTDISKRKAVSYRLTVISRNSCWFSFSFAVTSIPLFWTAPWSHYHRAEPDLWKSCHKQVGLTQLISMNLVLTVIRDTAASSPLLPVTKPENSTAIALVGPTSIPIQVAEIYFQNASPLHSFLSNSIYISHQSTQSHITDFSFYVSEPNSNL